MLSPADAALVKRDTAIPGLATLLDQEAFAGVLQGTLTEQTIEAVSARYVRYKPGENCLVAYEVSTDTGEMHLYAKARRPGRRTKYRATTTSPAAVGCVTGGSDTLKALSIALYAMPDDAKLPALARLDDAGEQARLLEALMPGQPAFRGAAVRRLRYKPERRYVGQVVGEHGECAVLKLYSEAEYRAARRGADAFSCAGTPWLARPIGISDEYQALAYEWLPGCSLDAAMRTSERSSELPARAGAALAELHMQSATGLAAEERDDPAAPLVAAAESIAALCPELGPRARNLANRLAADLAQSRVAPCPIHGDFYADQVLVFGDAVTLLDLDNAGYGDPAADLGSFVAHSLRDTLCGMGSPREAQTAAADLLAGYQAHRPDVLLRNLPTYTAAALLRLAPEAFRYRKVDWPAEMRMILGYAEQVLAHGYVST